MLQLISIALFALAGLSSVANAAPTGNSLMDTASPIANAAVGNMNTVPINWKRDHQVDHQQVDTTVLTEEFIKAAIAQAMTHQSKMSKREDEPFDLSVVFRGVFDKLIDYVIEVTPLNDIVHGNYDLLYDIFLDKVGELVSGVTAGAENAIESAGAPGAITNPLAAATGGDAAKSTDKEGHDEDDDEDSDEDYEDDEDDEDSHKDWDEYDEDNDEDNE
ncbi:hypothetical protein EDC94DRAFT_285210 [Helicostylum pulchrum]|uniref:Uncharacterized protein n=1 Tax=Helicostylum pulchrum TaxID=562976 RepID=A0ABP9YBU6_9FUNG|nr:hypothetical protein EDC94DRAFT_285210 [Helicostylum pulchrum]